ncbi:MAG TPA: spore germination protein [Pseudobacteroides sp.]|uniref:spore germination protein n=1 Tax=Pseudobacteroides sp. TaxID=1968840 RepID=UPI002F93E77E
MKIFQYKEPKNNSNFELLENEYEGLKSEDIEAPVPNNQNENPKEDKSRKFKKPLHIKEWNEVKEESENQPATPENLVDFSLQVNLQRIKKEFRLPKNNDIVLREFKVAGNTDACIVFVDGMIDKNIINDYILRPLMKEENFAKFHDGCLLKYIADNVISVNDLYKAKEYQTEIIPKLLNGLTALFVEGCEECLLIESKGYEKRSVDKPVAENVISGPQEAFTENLRTNITLIRRMLKNKELVTEILPIGGMNNSSCALMYLDGVTSPELVKEVKKRICSIKSDFIMGNGMLEQFIEDMPFMIFPQVLNTERPDRAVSFLMEGQAVILTEGSPLASTVPVTFFTFLHTSEDSFSRWQYGTFLRLIRFFALMLAIFLPGLYVALILYHREMIPTDLLASIIKAEENVPFPTIVEVMIMELSFELIREAGIRVPGIIGTTLGIIGALILGQAAVAANIVSPILIIIVAITGLGNFAIPSNSLASGVRILRFAFILLGVIAGFYGISAGIAVLGGYLCSMKSFGVPFLSPVAPKSAKSKDVFLRQPIWKQEDRPDYMNTQNRKMQPHIARGWIGKKGDNKE